MKMKKTVALIAAMSLMVSSIPTMAVYAVDSDNAKATTTSTAAATAKKEVDYTGAQTVKYNMTAPYEGIVSTLSFEFTDVAISEEAKTLSIGLGTMNFPDLKEIIGSQYGLSNRERENIDVLYDIQEVTVTVGSDKYVVSNDTSSDDFNRVFSDDYSNLPSIYELQKQWGELDTAYVSGISLTNFRDSLKRNDKDAGYYSPVKISVEVKVAAKAIGSYANKNVIGSYRDAMTSYADQNVATLINTSGTLKDGKSTTAEVETQFEKAMREAITKQPNVFKDKDAIKAYAAADLSKWTVAVSAGEYARQKEEAVKLFRAKFAAEYSQYETPNFTTDCVEPGEAITTPDEDTEPSMTLVSAMQGATEYQDTTATLGRTNKGITKIVTTLPATGQAQIAYTGTKDMTIKCVEEKKDAKDATLTYGADKTAFTSGTALEGVTFTATGAGAATITKAATLKIVTASGDGTAAVIKDSEGNSVNLVDYGISVANGTAAATKLKAGTLLYYTPAEAATTEKWEDESGKDITSQLATLGVSFASPSGAKKDDTINLIAAKSGAEASATTKYDSLKTSGFSKLATNALNDIVTKNALTVEEYSFTKRSDGSWIEKQQGFELPKGNSLAIVLNNIDGSTVGDVVTIKVKNFGSTSTTTGSAGAFSLNIEKFIEAQQWYTVTKSADIKINNDNGKTITYNTYSNTNRSYTNFDSMLNDIKAMQSNVEDLEQKLKDGTKKPTAGDSWDESKALIKEKTSSGTTALPRPETVRSREWYELAKVYDYRSSQYYLAEIIDTIGNAKGAKVSFHIMPDSFKRNEGVAPTVSSYDAARYLTSGAQGSTLLRVNSISTNQFMNLISYDAATSTLEFDWDTVTNARFNDNVLYARTLDLLSTATFDIDEVSITIPNQEQFKATADEEIKDTDGDDEIKDDQIGAGESDEPEQTEITRPNEDEDDGTADDPFKDDDSDFEDVDLGNDDVVTPVETTPVETTPVTPVETTPVVPVTPVVPPTDSTPTTGNALPVMAGGTSLIGLLAAALFGHKKSK